MFNQGRNMRSLPFQPLTFRDFMLYERHAIDAARGFARRFMPAAYVAGRAYERLTGRIFPPFRPNKLWYCQPIYYMSNPLTFVPSGTNIVSPEYTKAFDYELELGFVLGRPLFNATPEEATNAIASFVVICDFSARDVQKQEMDSGFGPQKSKHFLSSMSDLAVPADDVMPTVTSLSATVEINGKIVVHTSTQDMRYSLGEVLAHASRGEQLYAGELFGTGTLPGGSGMENGHWLKSGDRLRLSIEHIGSIEHTIT
jgi:2-keto-4-pentenoate hydratase/2-oxohepta-3-ene-1,7-dioic acid hydratase in catechol pathway